MTNAGVIEDLNYSDIFFMISKAPLLNTREIYPFGVRFKIIQREYTKEKDNIIVRV